MAISAYVMPVLMLMASQHLRDRLFVSWAGLHKGKPGTKQCLSHLEVQAIALACSCCGLQLPEGLRVHTTQGLAVAWALFTFGTSAGLHHSLFYGSVAGQGGPATLICLSLPDGCGSHSDTVRASKWHIETTNKIYWRTWGDLHNPGFLRFHQIPFCPGRKRRGAYREWNGEV